MRLFTLVFNWVVLIFCLLGLVGSTQDSEAMIGLLMFGSLITANLVYIYKSDYKEAK